MRKHGDILMKIKFKYLDECLGFGILQYKLNFITIRFQIDIMAGFAQCTDLYGEIFFYIEISGFASDY